MARFRSYLPDSWNLSGILSRRAKNQAIPGYKDEVYDKVRSVVTLRERTEALWVQACNAGTRSAQDAKMPADAIAAVVAKAWKISKDEVNAASHLSKRSEKKARSFLGQFTHVLRK